HRSVEDARDSVGQRLDALRMQILVEEDPRERANMSESERARPFAHERPRRRPRALLRARTLRLRCSHAPLYASARPAWKEQRALCTQVVENKELSDRADLRGSLRAAPG